MDEGNRSLVKTVRCLLGIFFYYKTESRVFMDFFTSDHVRIHYTDTGDKTKPVIVGIPGLGSYSSLWQETIAIFENYRFIMMDPRNQGQSERTFKGQRMGRHAADLAELLDKLDLHEVIGIGNSMGAATLWAYLDQYGKGRMKCMIDLDQSPKMVNDETWKYGFQDLTWDNFLANLKLPLGNAFFNQISPEVFAKAKAESKQFPYELEANYAFLIDHAAKDWRDVLLDPPVPMLLIAGKNSPYFDPGFLDAVKAINPALQTKVIPNCGHIIQAEQPQKLYKTVQEFLNNLK